MPLTVAEQVRLYRSQLEQVRVQRARLEAGQLGCLFLDEDVHRLQLEAQIDNARRSGLSCGEVYDVAGRALHVHAADTAQRTQRELDEAQQRLRTYRGLVAREKALEAQIRELGAPRPDGSTAPERSSCGA